MDTSATNTAAATNDKRIEAQTMTVLVEVHVPKNPRNNIYQLVIFKNEKGETILENKDTISLSRWETIIKTEAGKKIQPRMEDEYFAYPMN